MPLVPRAPLTATAVLAALAGAACTDAPHGAPPCADASGDGPTDGLGAHDGAGDGTAPTDAGPDGGTALAAVDDFIAALTEAMCSWQFRCCNLVEIDVISASSYLTEADCRLATSLTLGTFFVDARASAAENRLSLDPTLADACVQLFRTGACATPGLPMPDPIGMFTTCADPFVGLVPAGSPCRTFDECAAGARCVAGGQTVPNFGTLTSEGLQSIPTVSSVAPQIGSCLPYVPKGGKCRVTNDCDPGLYCRGVDFVCAAPAGPGDPCRPLNDPSMPPSVGPPCDDVHHQLVCLGNVCGRYPRGGEPCLADNGSLRPLCDPDPALALSCVGMGFNGSGICEKAGGVGAACGAQGLPPCAADLACVVDAASLELGTCQAQAGPGEVCRMDQPCAPPYVCDLIDSFCTTPGAAHDGEPCQLDTLSLIHISEPTRPY